ncbi:LysR family transcriptional regulator [Streptomyces venezuelae]|uniref:LysR family transcriptional regulator n=1 Tax=Streptomyces venezuelae TaxID=54571 RepID=UPI00278C2204|nr:LysR family transcriptional regulator [Streptomyces venezuelae]
MNVELRHARVVTAIDRAGSISKAAAELGLPQSSLTAQLRRIEKALGGELFVRTRSGVTPTPLGERLTPMLADLVRQADLVIAEATAYTSDVFRFGNTEWTPPSLRAVLQEALPVGEVRTETLAPAAAMTAARGGALDAALVTGRPGTATTGLEPPLAGAVVVREPVWLAVPPGHPLAGRSVVDVRDLAGLRWIRYAREHWFHPIEKQLFARVAGPDPEVLHHVDGHHEAMNWVRDADAAALTTPTGATKEVTLVPIRDTERTELLLVWRGDALAESMRRGLLETVRRYYRDYARTIPRYWPWIVDHPEEFAELGPFPAP